MHTKVTSHVPEMACYICDSVDVAKLCHHCGRAMCSNHGPFTIPEKRFYNQIENCEYTNLGLEESNQPNVAVHCEDCVHYVISYEPLCYILGLVGLLAITVGLFLSPVALAVSYAIVGIAIVAVSIWATYIERSYRHHAMCKDAALLPVFGRFPSVTIKEYLKGSVRLTSDSTYLVEADVADGTLEFSLQLTVDNQERLKKYRQKYDLLTQTDLSFQAGFVVLYGTQKIWPKDWYLHPVNPFLLTDQVVNQPFLQGRNSSNIRRWKYIGKYNLILDDQFTAGLPIQIVPTLLSQGKEWALELNVQLNPKINTSSLDLPRVKELKLIAPGILGKVESQTPSAKNNYVSDQEEQTIVWKGESVELQNRQIFPHKTFYLRFSKSRTIQPDMEVYGCLKLQFEGAISGLDGVAQFSPLGYPISRDEITLVRHTDVEINFRFHLSGLHVRKLHVISGSVEQLTAIPSSDTVTRLVEALSDKDIYVQRVIENPPQMNWANAQIVDRKWVIAGRRYKKATPIDFGIVATGKEQYEDTDKPHDGNTTFEITTQGTIIKNSMRADIESLHQDIVDVIQSTPSLRVDDIVPENQLFVDTWGTLCGTVTNTGEVTASDINVSVTGLKVNRTFDIRKLERGEKESFKLGVYPEKKGDVPITITVVCKDTFGQLPPSKKRYHIRVEEVPSTPVVHHESHFHSSVTGSIHTGSGHIKNDHEQVNNNGQLN